MRNIGESSVIVLWITLGLLLFFITYRQLLNRLKRGRINKDLYITLHPIEKNPASGIVSIFIESKAEIEMELSLIPFENHNTPQVIEVKKLSRGGNILQLDTTKIENGIYFYQAKTQNQKTRKIFEIRN